MVPNGWEHKSFKQILKLDRGSSPRPIVNFVTDSDDGVNWIKIGDTKGEAAFINSTKQKITKEGAKKSRKVSKGEIILSNSMSYGKPYILNIDGFIHDGWFVIRNYEQNLERDYLIQLLGGELVQRQYKRLAAGGVVTNISSELVYFVKVDVPPLQEQRKIATILGTWDKAIRTTERLIDNSQQQKKALMQQLLTGKKRLLDDSGKPIEGEWKKVELGKLLDYKQPTPYLVKSTEYSNEYPTPVLTAGKTFILGYSNEDFGIFKEELPAIIFDDFTTASKFVDFPFKAKSSAMKILVAKDGVSIKYIYEAMQVLNYPIGGHQRHWISIFANLVIGLPSQEEQQKIAAVLVNSDKEVELLEQQLADLKQEKKALMQQLLTGKRRVKIDNIEAA
jgi:type I restriction enzyme S subunit